MSKQDFERGVAKAVGDVKNPEQTDLSRLAEENGGFYTYDDSAGATTEGQIGENTFDQYDKISEASDVQKLFSEIEKLQEEEPDLRDAVKKAQKSIFGNADVTADVFLSNEMTLVSGEQTPVHDTMPRVAIEPSDTVKIDEIAGLADAGTTDQTSGTHYHGFHTIITLV